MGFSCGFIADPGGRLRSLKPAGSTCPRAGTNMPPSSSPATGGPPVTYGPGGIAENSASTHTGTASHPTGRGSSSSRVTPEYTAASAAAPPPAGTGYGVPVSHAPAEDGPGGADTTSSASRTVSSSVGGKLASPGSKFAALACTLRRRSASGAVDHGGPRVSPRAQSAAQDDATTARPTGAGGSAPQPGSATRLADDSRGSGVSRSGGSTGSG